jgi:hypothetical protein
MHKTFTALTVSAVVGTVGAVVLVAGAEPARTPVHTAAAASDARTSVDPSDFSSPVANPWFPLEPGTTTVLRGTDEGERFRERVRVTSRTRTIAGVTTRAVRDILRRTDGSLAEATTDWYADDNAGNVWYFGERTATYDEHGHLESREGSWLAGVHGATAGLIMPADPKATDAYRQEFYPGHAEDQAWIVGFKASLRVPAGRFRHVVRTFEWSRLEPGVVSTKLYAQGVGIVSERDVAGGSETFKLVAVRHG